MNINLRLPNPYTSFLDIRLETSEKVHRDLYVSQAEIAKGIGVF